MAAVERGAKFLDGVAAGQPGFPFPQRLGLIKLPASDLTDFRPSVAFINGADIVPEPIRWLWDGWLARGKLHMLAGAPGTGKTTIALSFAATITTGGRFPDGSHPEAGNVLIWSGEDDAKDVLVPRLMVCGADMRRVFFVDTTTGADGLKRPFDPATDIPLLRESATKIGGVSFLMVDPVVSAVAGDSNQSASVRRSLQPLVDLGQELDCAILGISHFSKGTGGADPVERVTGSVAFGAFPRVVMAAAKRQQEEAEDGKGSRMLARAKSNISTDTGAFGYDLNQEPVPGYPDISSSLVLWGQAMDGTARELLAQAEHVEESTSVSAKEEAKEFVESFLAAGAMPSDLVMDRAKQLGIKTATLRRAMSDLRIESKKDGVGKWFKSLPEPKMLKNPEDAHLPGVSTFAKNEHLPPKTAQSAAEGETF